MSQHATSEPSFDAVPARAHRLREAWLPAALFAGDSVCAVAGMIGGYFMRYRTPIAELGVPVPDTTLQLYLPLLLTGAGMLLATYAYLQLYNPRLLLRRIHSLGLIMKAMSFWLVAYFGISAVLKFEPAISRLFVVVAFGTTLAVTYGWRNLFYFIATRPAMIDRIKQRVAVLGSDARTGAFLAEIARHRAHPFAAIGYIGEKVSCDRHGPAWLGGWRDLEAIIRRHQLDIVVVGSLELPHDGMLRLIEICERTYTEWKIIPSSFELFVSNLQLETHGGIPVLGVGPLAIRRLFHRSIKRCVDVLGASAGLLFSLPIISLSAVLIRRESPGPVLFRQRRVGAHHREFVMLKLRTMRPDAEAEDNDRQSTTSDDPRVLRIGRFLRRWNLDELPQFWNVLRGDMSLVGPRPERPHHVDRLTGRIPHYLPRHLAKPGMTGWAQVNGCRGEGDLERRIQHDIFYLENWTHLLDLQIFLLTFVRWRAPE